MLLRDASGEKNKRMTGGKVVKSLNESVRGVWSGMHAAGAMGSEEDPWSWGKKKAT